MNRFGAYWNAIKKQCGRARCLIFFVLLALQSCSDQDRQEVETAAPKTLELNVHFPIPVEAWPLPDE